MDPSRYLKNQFEDFKPPFADQLPDELVKIRNDLEAKNFFLPYLNQVNAGYPENDVYVGKYGVLLLYYFLDKKFPGKFRQHLLHFYSSCIGRSWWFVCLSDLIFSPFSSIFSKTFDSPQRGILVITPNCLFDRKMMLAGFFSGETGKVFSFESFLHSDRKNLVESAICVTISVCHC